MKNPQLARRYIWIIAFCVLLYSSIYIYLVRPSQIVTIPMSRGQTRTPVFAMGIDGLLGKTYSSARLARFLFAPAYKADRWIRPKYWTQHTLKNDDAEINAEP